MENMRNYLLGPDVKKAQAMGKGVFIGRRMNNTGEHQRVPCVILAPDAFTAHIDYGLAGNTKIELATMYNGGGPGYLFDRKGMERVVNVIKQVRDLP
jgi:hypothetical protein